MTQRDEKRDIIRKHSSKKLLRNLQILTIVYAVLLVVTAYSVISSNAIFWQVIVAVAVGLLAGIIASRMYHISWDNNQSKVVARMDIYGILALVLFVIFELNKSFIAGLFSTGGAIGTISLVLVTSALYGRILGTGKSILRAFEKRDT